MSSGPPDLYVVCKSCGSEVSPYITECPYCGQRLRKRAPKIERDADGESRPKLRKPPRPTLGPLRTGEIPGIKGDEDRRPYATIGLSLLSLVGLLVLVFTNRAQIAVFGPIDGDWWRPVVSVFLYTNTWYQMAAVTTIALFGWLLERRHGPVVVVLLFALTGIGGIAAAAALDSSPVALGGNGAALGLLAAWAVPVILARRRHGDDDDEQDLLGTLVLAVLVAAMPIATYEASNIAGVVGLLVGGLAGFGLASLKPR